jgi:hypothetical protein
MFDRVIVLTGRPRLLRTSISLARGPRAEDPSVAQRSNEPVDGQGWPMKSRIQAPLIFALLGPRLAGHRHDRRDPGIMPPAPSAILPVSPHTRHPAGVTFMSAHGFLIASLLGVRLRHPVLRFSTLSGVSDRDRHQDHPDRRVAPLLVIWLGRVGGPRSSL